MRTSEAVKVFVGSVAVYVVMAACSAVSLPSLGSADGGVGSNGGNGNGGNGNSGNGNGGSGGGASGSGSGGGALLDAVANPVGSAGADPIQSGSRLKATSYVGSDGSKQLAGLHDTQLNVDCAYSTASDGSLRCLPSSVTNAYVGTFYGESSCTTALAYQGLGCAAPAYAVGRDSSSSCGASHVYGVAGVYGGAEYFVKSGTTCTGESVSLIASSYVLYSLGAELPPNAFVQATIQTD